MKSLLKSAEALFQESKNNTSLLANASSFIMHSIKDVNYPPLNRSGGFLSKPMYPPVTQ